LAGRAGHGKAGLGWAWLGEVPGGGKPPLGICGESSVDKKTK